MDEELERTVRELLAGEQFGVLATTAGGRLHTATILFAEADSWETVHAIRPLTLKAQLAYLSPHAAFQVDNRSVTQTDRSRFIRAGFEGTLRHVSRDDPDWERYRDAYAAKLPFGAALLDDPEIELHVLTPSLLRVAAGAHPAEDFAVAPRELADTTETIEETEAIERGEIGRPNPPAPFPAREGGEPSRGTSHGRYTAPAPAPVPPAGRDVVAGEGGEPPSDPHESVSPPRHGEGPGER